MEESGAENLDGSSIKPVSSLRSHFEQMAGPRQVSNAGPRVVAPKPSSGIHGTVRDIIGEDHQLLEHDRQRTAKVGERDYFGGAISGHSGKTSPSPSRSGWSGSPAPPEVNILPPQSPPKNKGLNLTLPNPAQLLAANGSHPRSAISPSPRQFRIPSRPHTPGLESRGSPILSSSQPPSPPPPRRSSEYRRDEAAKGPPTVNRTDKPKVGNKPVSKVVLTQYQPALTQSPKPVEKQPSPFSTPPSSDESPERDITQLPRLRPPASESAAPTSIHKDFAPPPVHHSVASKRREHEISASSRGPMSPDVSGDQRPALPVRPSIVQQNTMPAPPPRPSMDRNRTMIPTLNTELNVVPPKRIFSNPISQPQTPTRTHGRSMTVDRTSEKAPREFRTAPVGPGTPMETRKSFDVAPISQPVEAANIMDYPEASFSNRREPCMKHGAREISAKHETRIFDVCGEFACTSGVITRVWSLLDGEIILNLAHPEGMKITAVAFKATANVKDEGTRIWLGNNIGEVMEVDVSLQSVVACKSNAHTRREVIRIYRYRDQMWTLDDGGTLHLWAPDINGAPILTNPYQSFRLPKGHTFSVLVEHELWLATGKDIRVFMPTLDGTAQFQVLQRPLSQPNTADVTSGAIVPKQPDRVYFGHVDGKISIYAREDYACLGIVNVSLYKITSLAGVGGNLWAGFSTGMVYVYDTTRTPWVVRKDWRAHHDPLISLIADRSSFWMLDRSQVISLGQDNVLRIWDGLLQDDSLEAKMQSQEAEFCDLQPIKALVMTWNAGASTPYHLQHSEQDAAFFRGLFESSDAPDILMFGFQELVDLDDKKRTAKSFFKSKKKDPSEQEHMSRQYRDWRDFLTRCLDDYMPRHELYQLLHTATLVGLFTCVFVKASLRERISNISEAHVKRGMAGLHGNKGALILRFVLDDTSMCFVNCHLAAGQTQTKDRNTDASTILDSRILPYERDPVVRQDNYVGGGDGTMILDHEICILNGDLNYRIDAMGRDAVVNAVRANNLSKLLERDQLLAAKRRNPWFRLRALDELPITFAPTYKYDVGTDNYDSSEKKRSPAWCDRILYRGRDRIQQLDYRRHEVRVSDHRPVTGSFNIIVKKISPKKRILKWEECQQSFEKMKVMIGNEARLDYLTNVLGFDLHTAQEIIKQR